jgi:hypothetical protein
MNSTQIPMNVVKKILSFFPGRTSFEINEVLTTLYTINLSGILYTESGSGREATVILSKDFKEVYQASYEY